MSWEIHAWCCYRSDGAHGIAGAPLSPLSVVSKLTKKPSHKLRPFLNDTAVVLTQAEVRCWPRDRWETKSGHLLFIRSSCVTETPFDLVYASTPRARLVCLQYGTNKLESGFSLGVGIEDGSRPISNMKANDTSVASIVLLSDGHHIAGAVRDRWLPR